MDSLRITLGDKAFDARPSFDAIDKIEELTGRSFTHLGADAMQLRIGEMATILHTCISATGHSITRTAIGNLLVECGWNIAANETAKILNAIFRVGPKEAPASGDTKSDDS